jgi:hypothetical protein
MRGLVNRNITPAPGRGGNEFFLFDEIIVESIRDDLEISAWHFEGPRALLAGASRRGVEGHHIESGVIRALDLDDAAVHRDLAHGSLILVERHITLEASLDAHHSAKEQCDDAIVGNDKSGVLFLHGQRVSVTAKRLIHNTANQMRNHGAL